jgi:acyl-CoA reductase-like NAD-dependent aldehyde dehydrogenase
VVAFTGSVAAGRQVAVACAEQLKPCIIEAGGSDPMIISSHAPVDVAVAGTVTAAFHLSGQICTSAERLFVVDEIYDEFLQQFVEATKQLRIGDGMGQSEIGPMVSEAARNKVQALIQDAVDKGATIACGGNVPKELQTGWFLQPTILTNVTDQMTVMRSECFGPLAVVNRVSSFDAAIEAANNSEFGLGASVFTSDLNEAIEASERLESGIVWVNNPLIDNDSLPFGGWKLSGLGRELGRQGLDAFRQSKMVIIDHQPKIHEWWYPYDDSWFYSGGGRKLS